MTDVKTIHEDGQKLYEFSGQVRRETERALLVYDGDSEHWLPKAQIDMPDINVFVIPEWLAIEKGIV